MSCDSKVAIRKVTQYDDHFSTTRRCRPDYDVESAIKFIVEESRLKITWSWVKGHAKNKKTAAEMTWQETMNDEADTLATAARSLPERSVTPQRPDQIISVSQNGKALNGRLSQEIRYQCTANDLRSYWSTRYNWLPQELNGMDTTGLKQTLNSNLVQTEKNPKTAMRLATGQRSGIKSRPRLPQWMQRLLNKQPRHRNSRSYVPVQRTQQTHSNQCTNYRTQSKTG